MNVNGAPAVTGVEDVEGGPAGDTIVGDGDPNVLVGGAGDDTIDGRGAPDFLDGGVGSDTVSYAGESAPVTCCSTRCRAGRPGPWTRCAPSRAPPPGRATTSSSARRCPSASRWAPATTSSTPVTATTPPTAARATTCCAAARGATRSAAAPARTPSRTTSAPAANPSRSSLAAGVGGGPGENDALSAIEDVVATPGPDTLTGDDGPNGLFAGAGRDTLSGLGGDDAIFGGDNRDEIDGGGGRDQLFGEGGDDSLAAFDNEADLVDCGASLDDDAQVDPTDTVVGCEYSRRLDIPIPVDGDQDGTVASFDCNDANPAINPAAEDVPGDGIDQNCDGFDEQMPYVAGSVSISTDPRATGRRIKSLRVIDVVKGTRLVATCTAPKAKKGVKKSRLAKSPCAFKTKTKIARLANRPVAFTTDFRNRLLPPGTQIQVRVTSPGRVGKVWIYRINRRSAPLETRRCLTKGNFAKPQKCPPEEA